MFKNDIDVTKFYKRTYWMLRIYSSICSIGCCIFAIICLFLDINKFPMKFSIFGYLMISAIGIEVFYLIVTSILLRFVFRDEINYKHKNSKASEIQEENESFDVETNNDDEILTNSHHKLTTQQIISTVLLVSTVVIVIASLICVAIFSK